VDEALGEPFGQLSFSDLCLRSHDVVMIPPKPGLPGWKVELEPGRPCVAVAGLADGAGIQKPAARL
jgi:hypothetical protein